MRKIVLLIAILLYSLYSEEQSVFRINSISRDIQVDALLMEWRSEKGIQKGNLTIDGALTPDHLIGYVCLDIPKSSFGYSIALSSPNSDFNQKFIIDTSFQDIYAALEISQKNDTTNFVAFEWQFPRTDLGIDSVGNINLSLLFLNNRDSIMESVDFIYEQNSNQLESGRNLPLQLLIIFILLVIFIYMKKKVRKRHSD